MATEKTTHVADGIEYGDGYARKLEPGENPARRGVVLTSVTLDDVEHPIWFPDGDPAVYHGDHVCPVTLPDGSVRVEVVRVAPVLGACEALGRIGDTFALVLGLSAAAIGGGESARKVIADAVFEGIRSDLEYRMRTGGSVVRYDRQSEREPSWAPLRCRGNCSRGGDGPSCGLPGCEG